MSFNPNMPITSFNHPLCDHCDNGVESAPCSCFDWPTPEDDTQRLSALEAERDELRTELACYIEHNRVACKELDEEQARLADAAKVIQDIKSQINWLHLPPSVDLWLKQNAAVKGKRRTE